LLPIAQNAALFSLLGTYYGGDGVRTFGLPDLRSRTPAGGGFASVDPAWVGQKYALGQIGGVERVTLLASQLPTHTHTAIVSSDPGSALPGGREPGLTLSASNPTTSQPYGPPAGAVPLSGAPLSSSGGNQPHPNIQPYQTINFNIALSGIFPSRG
jgi:microcystin-dependent protein